MKRVFCLILVLTLALVAFAGCGGGNASAPESSAAEEAASEPDVPDSEIPSEAPTEVTDGGEPVAAAGSREPIAKEEIKVGVIHITDPSEGTGYTYTHDLGIQGMQKTLGLEDGQIIRKNNVDDGDPNKIESAMRECIEEGANIIFATSWGYMDTCAALAEEYPDVIFCHGTGYKNNDTNFGNYFGRIDQARYLSGIAAGLKTESNKIGYVAAMGMDNSEVTGGLNAFAMGAASVNPDVEVYVKVTNSWYDPAGETAAARALIDEGCDVIGQHCDTANPQLEAEKSGVWGVGYNSDMSKDAPNATLTSVIWNWEIYYTEAVQAVIDGTWTPGWYYKGLADGFVDIAPLNGNLVAEGTEEAIASARAKIISGEFNVFDGVIETNDGQTIGTEGGTLDDETIFGGIKWYYKNVTLK